jgi:hypothetical protein
MGVLKFKKGFDINTQPIQIMIGTNSEAFVLGEILALSSGVLTKGAVDTDGTQQYICLAAVTGATGVANVPVVQLRESMQFECTSTATVATTLVGSAVTLSSAATNVTATTTKGCFVIDETDGATTNSTVVGHFLSAAAV